MTAILCWVALAWVAWQTVLTIRLFVKVFSGRIDDAIIHDGNGREPISEAEKWYRHEMRKYEQGAPTMMRNLRPLLWLAVITFMIWTAYWTTDNAQHPLFWVFWVPLIVNFIIRAAQERERITP